MKVFDAIILPILLYGGEVCEPYLNHPIYGSEVCGPYLKPIYGSEVCERLNHPIYGSEVCEPYLTILYMVVKYLNHT